jgi:hypothetical protein
VFFGFLGGEPRGGWEEGDHLVQFEAGGGLMCVKLLWEWGDLKAGGGRTNGLR